MVPNRAIGEKFDERKMKVLMSVKVVGAKLKEKWKAELFARIEDTFLLDVAERLILDRLHYSLRKGKKAATGL